MKFIGILLLLSASLFAGTPAYNVVDGNYNWEVDTTISSGLNFDSLKLADDSTQILKNRPFAPGWEYLLAHDAFTGTSSGSTKVSIRVDNLDINNNLIYSTHVDSFATADGELVTVPIGGTELGQKHSIWFLGYNGGTALNLQINRLYMFKRRVHIVPIPSNR